MEKFEVYKENIISFFEGKRKIITKFIEEIKKIINGGTTSVKNFLLKVLGLAAIISLIFLGGTILFILMISVLIIISFNMMLNVLFDKNAKEEGDDKNI